MIDPVIEACSNLADNISLSKEWGINAGWEWVF